MTELIWDGKYDKATGRKVAPLKTALPFQTVETVNESAQDRLKTLDLFASGRTTEWRNRLIWGDKKYVLPSLLPEFAGKVDLVYIDPPFDTGANFSYMATVPDDPETEGDQSATFVKEPSVIEQKAYRDTWGKGLDSYLKWFYETVVILRDLLSEKGSIYVHLDPKMSPYAKVVLDEVFGLDNSVGEIVWKRINSKGNVQKKWGAVHETILMYGKSNDYAWNQPFRTLNEKYVEDMYRYTEPESGRKYRTDNVTAPSSRASKGQIYDWKGYKLSASRCWVYAEDRMRKLDEEGRLVYTKTGYPQYKRYLDESEGERIPSWWEDINVASGAEQVYYPTQKPEALLERILKASSNEGDLVLDCFCGSGTTAAVAEKLGRRWITCDLGRFAIHTARKRLLKEGVKPFVVQNLGKYERQTWQAAEFGDSADSRVSAYRDFILELYRARPISGYLWLHGVKTGRMVHVGGVDAPISTGDIAQIALELKKSTGTGADAPTSRGVDVLGWDFAFELNEMGKKAAQDAGVDVRFVRIPREVLEKKAVEQGDIRFFELAALSVEVQVVKQTVTLSLTDFVIPTDDVPADIQKAITHWSQWVDYWAVDWDHKGDTFHNQWQAYRIRKKPDLQRSIVWKYDAPGTYRIVVKVIDILGNDTTKTVEVVVE